MSCSTSILSRNARSSRQSGLKKPRPLRSVSLQEPADTDERKSLPQRQLSSGCTGTLGDNSSEHFLISEGIFAMSAMLAADDDQEDSTKENSSSIYTRQSSNSSYSSYADCETLGNISRQDSNDSRTSFATPRSSISQSHKRVGNPKQLHLDMNSNNLDLSTFSRNEDNFENTPLATLLTPQGEKLILAGKSMQTILGAAKILVREMGASIVSLRVEDLNDEDMSPSQSSPDSVGPLSPIEPVKEETVLDKEVFRYSKEELLALSESDMSRKPPVNWTILMHTHSDCCLPPDKMKKYFEAIDFHTHDGTLVKEDRRLLRETKEYPQFYRDKVEV